MNLKPSIKKLHLFNHGIYGFSVISHRYLQFLYFLLFTVVPLTLPHPLNTVGDRSLDHSLRESIQIN